MTKIKLVFKSIIEAANSQRVVSFVLVVSLIITNLVLLFLYSFLNNKRQSNTEEDPRIRLYSVKLNNITKDYSLVEKFLEKMESSQLPELMVSRISNDTIDIFSESIHKEDSFGKTVVTAFKYEQRQRFYIEQGEFFTEDDEVKAHNVLFVSNLLYDSSKLLANSKKPTKVNGVDYTIKGVGAMPLDIFNAIIMPYSTLVKNNVGYTEVNVLFAKILNHKEREIFIKYMKEYFPESDIILPPQTNKSAEEDFYSSLIIVIAIIALALVNAMSLFKFLVSNRASQYLVYRVCGATKSNISFLILTEVLLLATVLFVASVLLCTIIINGSQYVEQKLLLDIKGMFVCYLIAILVSLGSVSLTIFRIPNDTSILKNKY